MTKKQVDNLPDSEFDHTVIHLTEPASEQNFYEDGYLFLNSDVRLAKERTGFDASAHLTTYGLAEERQQVKRAFLEDPVGFMAEYATRKFQKFECVLTDGGRFLAGPGRFPISYGDGVNATTDYQCESVNRVRNLLAKEMRVGPGKIYADIGAGFSTRLFPNCINVEVYPSLTTDIIYEDGGRLPIKSESLDGVGCFAVLEHTKRPWHLAGEVTRILKPGGRIFVGYPFLQPYHGFPNHYFNATHSGLLSLFENDFEDISLETKHYQGADFTLNWILRGIVSAIADPEVKREVLELTIEQLLNQQPQSELYLRILGAMNEQDKQSFACGNTLIARKK